jgi:hypothetical protein
MRRLALLLFPVLLLLTGCPDPDPDPIPPVDPTVVDTVPADPAITDPPRP